jgi:hypothetical protein
LSAAPPGKGHFLTGRKDAHIEAPVTQFIRKDKGRFGEIDLAGDLLHFPVGQAGRMTENGQLVAGIFAFSEHIHNRIRNSGHHSPLKSVS